MRERRDRGEKGSSPRWWTVPDMAALVLCGSSAGDGGVGGRVLGFVKVEVLDSGVMTFRPAPGLRAQGRWPAG